MQAQKEVASALPNRIKSLADFADDAQARGRESRAPAL